MRKLLPFIALTLSTNAVASLTIQQELDISAEEIGFIGLCSDKGFISENDRNLAVNAVIHDTANALEIPSNAVYKAVRFHPLVLKPDPHTFEELRAFCAVYNATSS
ncbi:hypothetical protein [Vibrio agarivorans]|uniref:Uncharacterized protein n=1 Tax=Vibrio agarivorans TaxID=153622 RepID=A0ABT7Y361_9VIBR|nr:hypothetical protein [Vibrio agarivorans]MDN2482488.1 hypothetical protein [Vibrio agarivorans]